jgi:hypothetical protein
MALHSHRPRRRGTTLIEASVVYPVVLLLTLGVGVVGLGVFRYQQVASVAREGARYASVHGGQWAKDYNGNTLTTPTNIYNNAIQPHATGLDTGGMTLSSSGGQGTSLNFTVSYADSGQMPTYSASGKTTTNIVTVTVHYTWVPEAYLGSITLSSTSKMPISY